MNNVTRAEAGKLGWAKSKEIFAKKYQERLDLYLLNPNTCSNCGSPLEYKNRKNTYCSRSCSASQGNRGQNRHGTEKVIRECEYCHYSTTNPKYCSKVCCKNDIQSSVIRQIENGTYDPKTGTKILRDYIIQKRGYKCSSCNLSEWLGQQIPLDLDHIDGNSSDSSLENIRLLCKNCHALTPTYGIKNKGRGRSYRYKKDND